MQTKIFFSAVCILFMLISSASMGEDSWRYMKTKNGIKLYKRPYATSKILELKATVEVNARLEVIESVLRDIPAYPEFMSRCIEGRLLQSFGKDDLIIVNVTKMPWPLKDRDVVVKSIVEKDFSNGMFSVTLKGMREPESSYYYPLRKDRVRMYDLTGKFILEIMDRETTRVSFIAHFDPSGLPSPIVNFFSDEHPYLTILGLSRMVKKDKYISRGKESKDIYMIENFLRSRQAKG